MAKIESGTIIMWSGNIASPPTGWVVCNGSNGTPDLRNRFIVGAGSTYAVAATGGADSVTLTTAQLPSHTHGLGSIVVAAGGAHSHTFAAYSSSGNSDAYPGSSQYGATFSSGTTSASGSHSHSFSGNTGSSGSGNSHENRPAYMALAYIMKA